MNLNGFSTDIMVTIEIKKEKPMDKGEKDEEWYFGIF